MSTNNYQQQSLFKEQRLETLDSGPETCLGKEYPNSEARRAHFTEELRKKLQDPEFRKIEGFPIGSDEDILNLSDPPYYTACPNPWIADFIAQWEKEKKVARVREWLSMKSVGQAFRPVLNFPEIREFQKKDLDYVHQYQRRLPHWELPGSSYFITFRSHKSVGQPFQAANAFQPASQLNMPNLLEEALWFFHQERYLLDAYVIMPDHVHLLIRPTQGNTLAKIMQGLKGYTARELNKIMERKGSFWQDENFDHLIRNGADWLDKFEYIHNNPVKAGLVENPEDYPYSSLVTLHAEGRLESLPHTQLYHREPFAADVSEGKNDPIYNAHSYHTKVPHKAIMRYILHYTQPGDIVFDGFCGTGMTGVAAQMCGDREVVMSLGYQVKPDGTILQEETDEDGKKVWKPFSKLGIRRAVLNDLSPAATFIAYNYNTPVDVAAFEKEAKRILKEVEEECGWMYETKHSDGRTGTINYVVWSDVFVCPECAEELIFWDVAVNIKDEKVRDEFLCEKCNAQLSKSKIIRAWFSYFDPLLNDLVKVAKQKPVLINYSLEGFSGRLKKKPDSYDLALIEKINNHDLLKHASTLAIPKSDKTSEPLRIGITHTHLFYTSRNLIILDRIFSKGSRSADWRAHATALINTKMNRWPRQRGPLSLTLFVGSIVYENNVFKTTKNRDFPKLNVLLHNLLTTQSATHLSGSENSLDYIFIDPPFGSNIYYSDLNIVWETWLRLRTNTKQEAIESRAQDKNSDNYRALMKASFKNAYNMLKPGRWLTVEFSNTKASIWNSIQTAITEAGFIIANVSALDKKQGSFNAVTNTTSVKQDLVISAYKPNGGFEECFQKEAQTEEGVWDFVRTHLKYLPVTKQQGALLQFVPERDPRILFDQMVAYYVRKGYPVPISSQEFQVGLAQRFIERDGMYFLPDQVAEYDRKKMTSGEPRQMTMFVSDEASAIQWLRQLIKVKPQTFPDINPQFMQQLGGWSKNEAQLYLRELLSQNFICYDGKGPVPEQIHAYLSTNWKELRNLPKDDPTLVAKASDRWYVPDPNKAGDLEKLREKALLKEFEEYVGQAFSLPRKKLKVFRVEAVRAGFKKAWQERDYETIINVAEKIPNKILEEDPKLLMWYDQAVTRMGGE